ncbi:hypothetical protein [Chenggangzhangella methanolivorans]|uniref:Uncharacterized protein n=1 Tax=Chenggangzhangella methanolivorans TaxID=1437009 RepID=A0A9E6R7Z1_9HYPH|nr:hypothetical protein [Chenggangzhangella methanolivorans]QZN99499.1 hypothetical protein K6K41_22765 [Chenggangzhangella methanolivorans]
MTPIQRDLARHALGLPNARCRSYRNHFGGPRGEDLEAWSALVADGLARRFGGSSLTGGDDCYVLTRKGALQALVKNEQLDPEDFPSPEMVAALRRLSETGTATHWIAKACSLDTAAARRFLKRLAKEGFVEGIVGSNDWAVRTWRITPRGQCALRTFDKRAAVAEFGQP